MSIRKETLKSDLLKTLLMSKLKTACILPLHQRYNLPEKLTDSEIFMSLKKQKQKTSLRKLYFMKNYQRCF